jgi:hypothetical protein
VADRIGHFGDDFEFHAPLVQPVPGIDDAENGANQDAACGEYILSGERVHSNATSGRLESAAQLATSKNRKTINICSRHTRDLSTCHSLLRIPCGNRDGTRLDSRPEKIQ